MKITLEEYMPRDERWLGRIASQSHNDEPLPVDDAAVADLFAKTRIWMHDSIKEHAIYRFHLSEVSRVAHNQIVRHRSGKFNARSGRHKKMKDMVVPPSIEAYHPQYKIEYDDGCDEEWENAPLEDKRYYDPFGQTISFYMTIDGRNLVNFLRFRLDRHAQWEARLIAKEMWKLVKEVHPQMVIDVLPECSLPNICTMPTISPIIKEDLHELIQNLPPACKSASPAPICAICEECKNKGQNQCSTCFTRVRLVPVAYPSNYVFLKSDK